MIAALLALALTGPTRAPLVVRPGGAFPTLSSALARARSGDTILVEPGTYREPTIRVTRPVTILGHDWPVLDGALATDILIVAADDVTVRGIAFRNVGPSFADDRAALRVAGAGGCRIESNRFDRTFFAIYLARASRCTVTGNVIHGSRGGQSENANAIHLYASHDILVSDNVVSGHRDGIYLEFARGAVIRRNVSSDNSRYGLHFMFSDSCEYTDNAFRRNAAGVAVMYSHYVAMTGNEFSGSRGPASYGLLLKELRDSRIVRNRFDSSTVGLHVEGSNRTWIEGNEFTADGWGLRLMADADDVTVVGNRFEGNSFDLTTNSTATRALLQGNYWARYQGYDLDRDGYGDVPFAPVRLFALIVEQHPAALVLARSPLVDLLDAAERTFPVLTPGSLVDPHPAMRWSR